MTTQKHAQSGTSLLQVAPPKLATQLAKPWHYRRNGRYYLRFRPRNQTLGVYTVSLRTTDRAAAMDISKDIITALAVFHLDRPAATWGELRERLKVIAEECLSMAHGDDSLAAYSMIYDELRGALARGSSKLALNVDQQRALGIGKAILQAAQDRLEGRPDKLVQIIDKINQEEQSNSHSHASVSLSVGAPQEPLTWAKLSGLYMAEHSVNLKETSRKAALTTHTVIGEAFEAIGVTDLKKHTRENLTNLRTQLLEDRKASTVNNLLAKLKAVLAWAVRADHLAKQYADKLQLTKGADSARVTFTRGQVVALMEHAGALPATSWERWALSLCVITGARVGEISYLTKEDVREVDGLWCIDINEDSPGKSIKNKHSKRLVPLVDGALGFDLQLFLQAVDAGALPSAHGIGPGRASQKLNLVLKDVLGGSKDKNQTLHSLRHHLISAMQAAGVPVAFAQAAAGQSSGTIAYDGYGSGSPIQRVYEAIQLGLKESAQ
jgi:integrase